MRSAAGATSDTYPPGVPRTDDATLPPARGATLADPPGTSTDARPASRTAPDVGLFVLLAIVVVLIGAHDGIARALDAPAIATWTTLCVAVSVQALPFLALGILVSTAIATLVPPAALARALPERTVLAVPVAGLAGALLPGCECGSVPVASGLISRGVPQAVALTFLLSAPAVNPVVLVSTYIAFPGRPGMVLARLAASLATAVLVGLLWSRFGRSEWLVPRAVHARHEHTSRRSHALEVATHDFLQAGGFLVVGAMTSATLRVVVPADALDTVAGNGVFAVLALVTLAVVLAVCSEADAFVAASLTQFSLTARLAFLVVGPVADVKLFALHIGTFGRRFAARFSPLVLCAALLCSVLTAQFL